MVLVGTYSMKDVVRPDIPNQIIEIQNSGVTVLMATGDNKLVADRVAREAGILPKTDNSPEHTSACSLDGCDFRAIFGDDDD